MSTPKTESLPIKNGVVKIPAKLLKAIKLKTGAVNLHITLTNGVLQLSGEKTTTVPPFDIAKYQKAAKVKKVVSN